MERLTKKFTDGGAYCDIGIEDVGIKGINAPTYVGEAINKLADYEDAEEQGLLLRLPCKVGDTIYLVDFDEKGYDEAIVESIEFCRNGFRINSDCEIGIYLGAEYLFLTKEEAEEKLAEMKGK